MSEADKETSLEPVYESLKEPDLNLNPTNDLIELEPVLVIELEETTGPASCVYVPSLSIGRKLTKKEQKM